ncbi:zinc finger protein GAI-ASSOCIATED FACTOR 1 isoform X2 [Cucumis sativus]|uniref:zinc finger protein GAI-ASSOCIATED FACTOR 1 isoform X2 n=1 Tax=Cucumis sativus TaxID=3659 RepID=UPI0012F48766|nr:zinc finger protein GAI-ASSOCIATED FACTOR 1 isoform X2 [Cucumis sativus]
MSKISGCSDDGGSFVSDAEKLENQFFNGTFESHHQQPQPQLVVPKKKRNLPGTPVPDAEVVALSPETLMATNRFLCEICNKGFQRDQNLQLHRRGHNLPWKLKQRTSGSETKRKVYVCPEPSCVHHDPGRALGDLTGIKKHFSRKHGEKKWKCEKCSKKYAVQSDLKAHTKACGSKEYKCDCGTIFSRRDSFITHRAFCDALAEEHNKLVNAHQGATTMASSTAINGPNSFQPQPLPHLLSRPGILSLPLTTLPHDLMPIPPKPLNLSAGSMFSSSISNNSATPTTFQNDNHLFSSSSALMSATALLQKAAQMGAAVSSGGNSEGFCYNHGSFFLLWAIGHQLFTKMSTRSKYVIPTTFKGQSNGHGDDDR